MAFLLGKKPTIDNELDQLFKQSADPTHIPIPGSSKHATSSKRKAENEATTVADSKTRKRVKTVQKEAEPATHNDPIPANRSDKQLKDGTAPHKPVNTNKKAAAKKSSVSDHDTDDSDLENAYLAKSVSRPKDAENTSDDEDDDEGDPSSLVHETESKASKKRSTQSKKMLVPLDESPEQKDQRTVFVGNLPLDVASKKPLKKALQRHLLGFAPSAKIESLRFRSVPFQAPTAQLPDEDNSSTSKKLEPRKSDPRAHDKERASSWRAKQNQDQDEKVQTDEKKYLNPSQKKRIAFINQEFHTTADAVNAYVVFSHPADVSQRPANLPPLPPTMDPYEAAVCIAAKADGSSFMERSIRVDLVGKTKATVAGQNLNLVETDPRLSVFVGSLDFATKEEDLRAFFESLVSTERGSPDDDADEEELKDHKSSTWVTRVRVIRDKDTQLGKGFAYVQFSDRECVDRILAMEEGKIKFAKRKLRVQKCKVLPSGTKRPQPHPSSSKDSTKSTSVLPLRTPVTVPKGDPRLGEKLAGLSKEERKQAKSADADRLARRLAKKKARLAMKPGVGKGMKKERKRVRTK